MEPRTANCDRIPGVRAFFLVRLSIIQSKELVVQPGHGGLLFRRD